MLYVSLVIFSRMGMVLRHVAELNFYVGLQRRSFVLMYLSKKTKLLLPPSPGLACSPGVGIGYIPVFRISDIQ